MIKIISRNQADNRRGMEFDPGTVILPGQVVEEVNGKAVLSPGTQPIAPAWAFTSTTRKDSAIAGSITVVEGPFIADIDADGYTGVVAAQDLLAVDTANHGKLKTVAASADATVMALVVARCVRGPSDGVIRIKALA